MSEDVRERILENVKTIKGIPDDMQDELLNILIDESADRIMGYINAKRDVPLEDYPSGLLYVLQDVTVKRFNRMNSEGASSDSEEGRSFTWKESYLTEHFPVLDSYHDPARSGQIWWY